MSDEKYVRGTPYLTLDGVYEEMREALEATALEHEWVQLGRSAQDNPLAAVCIGDGDFTKPELLYFGGTHAMEFIGVALNLALLKHVASQASGSPIADALSGMNIWFLPVMNPDGYLRVQKQLTSGIGFSYSRANANGVDLNRNFPVAFYDTAILGGSPFKISPYYRGSEPCSEPESRVLRDFILGRNFRISLEFHSFGNLIAYPYGYSDKECKDKETFRGIGREMLKRQKREKYRLIPMHKLYKVSGDIGDWMYDECRILAFTMEIGRLGLDVKNSKTILNPFYWANPLEPEKQIDNNLEALLYLIDAMKELFCEK